MVLCMEKSLDCEVGQKVKKLEVRERVYSEGFSGEGWCKVLGNTAI